METNEQFNAEIQEVLVKMMNWFHRFCMENDIRYYVIGGTMLGAARHQGFIPWDDDIDVGIPRKDYERLAALLSKRTDQRYVLETPHSDDRNFIYTCSKLYDTTTTLVEHARINIKRGIFIDIFPLDGAGNTLDESKKNFKKLDYLFRLYMTRVMAIDPQKNLYKRAVAYVAHAIPNFIIDNNKLRLKIHDICKEHDFDKCKYGGNMLGAWRFKEIMETRIMGTPTLYKFENIEVFGVEHYDEYLTHLYGDWRKLPPIEQQVTHHNFVECDLKTPFIGN